MSKRVLIIGGGVIGLSTAYYCARRGFSVTVIERNPAQRDGCSFGNAGLVVPSHFVPLAAPGAIALALKWMWNPASPFYLKPRLSWDLFSWSLHFWRAATARHVRRAAPLLRDLGLASRSCYEELAGAPSTGSACSEEQSESSQAGARHSIGNFGLVKKGLLMLCKEAHTLDEEAKTAEMAHSLGMPAEVLDVKQTAAREPDMRMDVAGSVYYPMDCHLVPDRFMAELQQRCENSGVKFIWNNEVVDWNFTRKSRHINGVVTSMGEPIEADEFILCSGSWSPLLARRLGLNLPLQAGKGYSLTLPHPRQLPQSCALLSEARVAVTPLAGALRFGGTMEIAGLNEDINPVRVQGIINAVPKYYPEFRPEDFNGIQPWRGLRPCSPDGLPFVGRTAKFANLSIAAGHSMMGMSLGPVTGRLISEILSSEKPALDISLLSPDRYGRN